MRNVFLIVIFFSSYFAFAKKIPANKDGETAQSSSSVAGEQKPNTTVEVKTKKKTRVNSNFKGFKGDVMNPDTDGKNLAPTDGSRPR